MENEKEKTHIATNLKYLRAINGKSLNDVANICGKSDVAVHYWENGTREPNAVDIAKLSNYFDITVDDLLIKDLRFDNAEFVDINTDTVSIPVLGIIRAGMPIEAQENIIDYVDIPREWTKGGKQFFGLKIKGNSMSPKYASGDTVVFESTEDFEYANNKDSCIMVNGFDATFKKFNINQSGVTLTPLNLENEDGYTTTFYDVEQVKELPVKVIGIARRKISDIE